MKYLALALLLFTACSNSKTVIDNGSLPIDSTEPAMSSDSLFAPEENTASPSPEAPLATPVEPAPSSDLALSEPTPPGPPPPPAFEPESTPSSDPTPAKSMPPVVAGAVSPSNDRNIRQDFEEYKDRMNTRADADDDFDARALFPHEDGAFQFGFDYSFNPYSEHDFDPTRNVRKSDEARGGNLAFNYFPLRSLTFGRLGAGLQAGATWAKFRGTGAASPASRFRFESYGAKAIYEFQYFLGQIVVPHAFFGYEKIKVKALSGGGTAFPSSRFNSTSYGGGAHINLNRLEPRAASKALATSGVRKFYLTYTFAKRSESTGLGHYLGLRFEY